MACSSAGRSVGRRGLGAAFARSLWPPSALRGWEEVPALQGWSSSAAALGSGTGCSFSSFALYIFPALWGQRGSSQLLQHGRAAAARPHPAFLLSCFSTDWHSTAPAWHQVVMELEWLLPFYRCTWFCSVPVQWLNFGLKCCLLVHLVA